MGIGVVVLLMVLSAAAVVAYKHFEGNIETADFLPGDRPTPEVTGPINLLVMGSDTREGANGKGIGGDTPGLSDTTILLHLSANRKFAYGVSLPRDAMVERPACPRKNGNGTDPGGITHVVEGIEECHEIIVRARVVCCGGHLEAAPVVYSGLCGGPPGTRDRPLVIIEPDKHRVWVLLGHDDRRSPVSAAHVGHLCTGPQLVFHAV